MTSEGDVRSDTDREPTPGSTWPHPRVLVVEDEPLLRWSLTETLRESGYEVVQAGDARGAEAAVTRYGPFDAVLLDLRLPDSTDLALLSRLRAESPGARLILMTAHGDEHVTRSALQRGAFQVVDKPFALTAMTALLSQSA
jgi:DNA-binding NtrC family response regulator